MNSPRPSIVRTAVALTLLAISAGARTPPAISAQGLLAGAGDPLLQRSPLGSLEVRGAVVRGDYHEFLLDLEATPVGGGSVSIPAVRANGFLATDVGAIVTLEASESAAVGTRVAVLDLGGRVLHAATVHGLSMARLADDGASLGYRSQEGLVVLDLHSFERRVHEPLFPFALGRDGRLAGVRAGTGVVEVFEARGGQRSFRVVGTPRKLSFGPDGKSLLVLSADALWRLDLGSGESRLVYSAPAGGALRDLSVAAGVVRLGLRTQAGMTTTGSVVQLASTGPIVVRSATMLLPPSPLLAAGSYPSAPTTAIPWPLAPNAAHPIGNTYGEYQDYSGAPYPHPGIDVLGADGQPVFAVAAGVVKAVLTTSAGYHWRVAIAQNGGAGTSPGYLYAHLDQPTIAVDVGDTVVKGQFLGNLVPWPVLGFTHCHFARIEDKGAVWSGSWLCTDNPQFELTNAGDTRAPTFENAVGSDLFAFCANETSNYQDPTDLHGAVDIVVHVGDQLSSSWVCAVKELRYTIHPLGDPGSPIVDDRLAVRFDMALDTYQNGPVDPFLIDLFYKQDATCNTRGDYNNREFFHIITNSDGNEVYESADLAQAWDTTLVRDGSYVIRVTATDPAGNATTAAMTVVTNNGNP